MPNMLTNIPTVHTDPRIPNLIRYGPTIINIFLLFSELCDGQAETNLLAGYQDKAETNVIKNLKLIEELD